MSPANNNLSLLLQDELSTALMNTQSQEKPYWQIATSQNTRVAYQADIRHFIIAGGVLPATTESVLHYLNQQAGQLNARTLKRRLVALKHWHTYQNQQDPTTHPLIKKTLRGIARAHGKPPEKAPVLSIEQLTQLVAQLNQSQTLKVLRDNALLQIGFFGAFRRSELVAIQWEHITFVPEGIKILIPRSKTDPEAMGKLCAIPYGQLPLCPVTALKKWQEASGFAEGFVFRAIRHGKCYSEKNLTPKSVSTLIKKYAIKHQWPNAEDYSGHSLRRGFATVASQRGASLGAIMRQGRWRHEATVHGYIQEGKLFEANAAATILADVASTPTFIPTNQPTTSHFSSETSWQK
jgi:integrase